MKRLEYSDDIEKLLESDECKTFVAGIAKGFKELLAKDYDLYQDILQECYLGVWDAHKNFDQNKNVLFTTYAVYWIRKRVFSFLNDNKLIYTPTGAKKRNKVVLGLIEELETLGQAADLGVIANIMQKKEKWVLKQLLLPNAKADNELLDLYIPDNSVENVMFENRLECFRAKLFVDDKFIFDILFSGKKVVCADREFKKHKNELIKKLRCEFSDIVDK